MLVLSSVSAFSAEMHGLRNQRYCEILLGDNPRHFQVYNTIGLNNCPAELWEKITPEIVKQETGARFVHLNGPRYWTIDGFENTTLINPSPKILGGINMRDAGVLKLALIDLWIGDKFYKEHKVHRQTTWIYQAGKPIYELVNPQGEIFVMQSYSSQKIAQTENDLKSLGSKLELPEGWNFRSRILKKEAHLTPLNEQAIVIQDNFLNTYQQETPSFIAESSNSSP